MIRLVSIAAIALAAPLLAQDEAPVTPGSIVAAAPAEDWVMIAPEDLLVMQLAKDADGEERRVVIQLMPPPFSQGWVENIRALAKAHWWDGTNIYRVQDNYVTQWGGGVVEKAEPEGLNVVPESEYASNPLPEVVDRMKEIGRQLGETIGEFDPDTPPQAMFLMHMDPYSVLTLHFHGWPIAVGGRDSKVWPIHCYGAVGVARGLEDTGSGGDLYAVIGHAPRQLDRNIAVVGRVIEGIEQLSSLPRGKGELGFYDENEADKRVPIVSVRLASDMKRSDRPSFAFLSTESESFVAYLHARANRQDDFYKVPAGGVDICNAPVPIRAVEFAK